MKEFFDFYHATLNKNYGVKLSGMNCKRDKVDSLKTLD